MGFDENDTRGWVMSTVSGVGECLQPCLRRLSC